MGIGTQPSISRESEFRVFRGVARRSVAAWSGVQPGASAAPCVLVRASGLGGSHRPSFQAKHPSPAAGSTLARTGERHSRVAWASRLARRVFVAAPRREARLGHATVHAANLTPRPRSGVSRRAEKRASQRRGAHARGNPLSSAEKRKPREQLQPSGGTSPGAAGISRLAGIFLVLVKRDCKARLNSAQPRRRQSKQPDITAPAP